MTLRIAIIATAVVASAPAFAPIRPIMPGEEATADTVSVTFNTRDSTSFHFTGDTVDSIEFHVRDKTYPLLLTACRPPLKAIHAETAELFWGSEHDKRANGTFTMTARFGAADSLIRGEFPRLQITFRNGKLAGILAEHKTAPDSSIHAPLVCSGT
jgi:hypothetical protein